MIRINTLSKISCTPNLATILHKCAAHTSVLGNGGQRRGYVTLTYDKNGNLTTDGKKFDNTYNHWGQLVELVNYSTTKLQARYTYSAMGLRVSEQLDSLSLLLYNLGNCGNFSVLDGVLHANQTNAYDLVFFVATDLRANRCNQTRVATYRGTDAYPKESFIHHDDRVRGPMTQRRGGGGPVARDREASLESAPENWASIAADTERFERSYYFADYGGNVSAILTHEVKMVEQIRYSANGVPFNIPLGDVNADGKVESGTGEDQHKDLDTNGPYYIRGDFDLDDDIDYTDFDSIITNTGKNTGRGYFSFMNNDLRIMKPGVEFGGFNVGIAYGQTNQSVVHLNNITTMQGQINPISMPGFPIIMPTRPCNSGHDMDLITGECIRTLFERPILEPSYVDVAPLLKRCSACDPRLVQNLEKAVRVLGDLGCSFPRIVIDLDNVSKPGHPPNDTGSFDCISNTITVGTGWMETDLSNCRLCQTILHELT